MFAWVLLACQDATEREVAPRDSTSAPADDTGTDSVPTGDSAVTDSETTGDDTGDSGATAESCQDLPADLWVGCVVGGELSESYSGEAISVIVVPSTTLLACDDDGCAWMFDTSCEFDPLDGTYGEFPCRGRYYPDGVAGSGIGELGWESDGYRTCLFGARAEGAALGLSPRPVGADADAETAGYSLASCSTDGVYDAEGTLTVE